MEGLEKSKSNNLLDLAEEVGGQLPTIAGVEVGRALTYDLVQFLNRVQVQAHQELVKKVMTR